MCSSVPGVRKDSIIPDLAIRMTVLLAEDTGWSAEVKVGLGFSLWPPLSWVVLTGGARAGGARAAKLAVKKDLAQKKMEEEVRKDQALSMKAVAENALHAAKTHALYFQRVGIITSTLFI